MRLSAASGGASSTRSVLNTPITTATETLILVSFASNEVADLTTALSGAIDRGVELTLNLETPNDAGRPLMFGPIHPFASTRDPASFCRWPLEAREEYFAATAHLHAKCVIADQSSALVTSANLASDGINDDMELGALVAASPYLQDSMNTSKHQSTKAPWKQPVLARFRKLASWNR